MHSYQHNIKTFNNATRHLTRVERSLYRDATELYYDTEQPLPAHDFDKLARRLLAHTEEEKAALKYVLDEFFVLTGDVYTHDYCDAVIEKYHGNATAKANAGKASAAKRKIKAAERKQRRATQGEQNATGVEQVLDACSTAAANHKPITNNQEKNIKPESFKQFFAAYPVNKKGGRDVSAWKKAKSLNLTGQDFDDMVADLARRETLTPKWFATYAPGICKYLDDHVWKTPVIPEVDHAANRPGSHSGTNQQKLTPAQRTAAKREALRSQSPALGIVATDGGDIRPPMGLAARGRTE